MTIQMIHGSRVAWLMVLVGYIAVTPSAVRADRKAELAAHFAERLPALRKLKDAGKIGETTAGLIEAVNPADGSNPAVVGAENADRQELYALIAKDQGTDAATVATRAAHRNYEKAKAGDYLKTATGEWKRKP